MHLARVPAYLRALEGGQILPRWASSLNYSYGMPLFNFYYHLPYLLGALFIALGTSLVQSFTLSLLVSFVFSGITMYLFASSFFADRKKGIVASVLYQFAPFHLVDLSVRGDPGELLAMGFLPLTLYFIHRIFSTRTDNVNMVWTGISSGLLILSHSAVSLMYYGVIFLFILLYAPDRKRMVYALGGIGLGLGIAAFYWIPVLFERKYTYGDLFMKDMFREHFAPVWHFFVPNITNDTRLQTGGVDISFGLVHTAALFYGVWMLTAKRGTSKNRRHSLYALMLTAGAFVLMTPLSLPLWERMSVLRAFQFPWRFLTIPVFSLSFLAAALLPKGASSRIIASVIAVTLVASVVYWRPPLGFDRVDESYFRNYPMNTTYFGETDLVWSAGQASGYPEAQFEIIEGEGEIIEMVRKDTVHTATVVAGTDIRVRDNTQYYPGWRVYAESEKIPIEFQDPGHRGLITFRIPQGTHRIRVEFGETPVRMGAEFLSVAMILFAVFVLVKKHRET